MDNIQPYRQPMITSTGIMLGFLLNFSSSWVKDPFSKEPLRVAFVSISLTLSITLLVIVLYRILNMHYPKERVDQYYKRTLFMFIMGMIIPFANIFLVMIDNILKIM
jgi:hypothetical protein